MSEIRTRQGGRKSFVIGICVTAVVVLSIVGAALWPGYDSREVPNDKASLWAIQAGSGKRYARVNTDLLEMDTVRSAESPTQIVQYSDDAVVFVDGNQHFASIDSADPVDFEGEAKSQMKTASGEVKQVDSSSGNVLFLLGNGDVQIASVEDASAALTLNPFEDDEVDEDDKPLKLDATAAALGANQDALVYSAHDKVLRRFNIDSGKVTSESNADFDSQDVPLLTEVGSAWVALDPESGKLWIEGVKNPTRIDLEGTAKIQAASADSDTIYIADEAGLWAVPVSGGEAQRVSEQPEGSMPAAPIVFESVPFAAWLREGSAGGTLWSEKDGEVALSYGGSELPGDVDPRLVTNGSRLMLNEAKTGWVWVGAEGELVPSSQRWDADDEVTVTTEETKEAKVTTPKPPIAEPDTFGVRAGSSIALPVLLNDHDPNEDILSVAPGSLEGLPEAFGQVEITNDGQKILARISPEAKGSATFTYQATDGTTADGLKSNSATVTLNVIPEDVAEAPVWCGVNDCLAQWPTPTVEPGGTVSTQVLGAWVDPSGDQFFLSDAQAQTDSGIVIANPDGVVTFSHNDPNATESSTIPVKLTVSNTRGKSATKTLNIQVTPTPTLELVPEVFEGIAGEPLQVDLRQYITGAKGRVSLVSVTSTDPDDVDIAISEGQQTFKFRSEQPRSFPLQVTLKDEVSEITASVRVVLSKAEDARISMVPINVFVRPSEDTTIDVLPAATNPANAVLMVSDLNVVPAVDAELFADVVGQRYIHASGSTNSGEPGVLGAGTYSLSDGTPNPNSATMGQVTFILLPPADEITPIASDERVTVTAGGQVDIPVLNNDIAPIGTQIAVDPASIDNESEVGLAFATNRLVRYLAPNEPGEYVLGYSIFNVGNPTLKDSARIFVTVKPTEDETVPLPRTLSGRALSGSDVSIPFDRSRATLNGVNVELSEITKQPKQGTAVISAEGDAIVYSSNPGAVGQDIFEYQVTDATGKAGKAEVRVGITNAEVSPAPITYSDYVQVEPNGQVSVDPVANDESPNGSALELIDVVPNAPSGTSEYERLDRLIKEIDLENGKVRLDAGPNLGTNSYIYTVRSSLGDTATGLIVVKVVKKAVLEYPVVSDTALTAETLPSLPKGVDVLTGRVSWSSGPLSDLKLSMYGDEPDYSVSGWNIKGEIPKESQTVPFKVTGNDFAGNEMETYAFLRVPTEKETRLALKAAMSEVEVNEGASVSVNLSEAIPIPKGEKLEIDSPKVTATGARANAKCSLSGTDLTYNAGEGAPWQDACVIPAKLASQETFTFLRLNVKVISKDPIPRLRAGAVTVSPGDTQTFDLNQLVEWDGQPQWDKVQFKVESGGELFETALSGSKLHITGKPSSQPSRVDPMTVTLVSHPDVAARTLAVTVGLAPSLLPVGANVVQTCEARAGVNQCVVPVVGLAGEVNPFPTEPLKVVAASGTSCSGVALGVLNEREVVASWPDNIDGGSCVGRFTVQDAQGRMSNTGGTVTIDLRGSPRPPASVTWQAYSNDSVVLSVTPASNESYPAVKGYKIQADGVDAGACRDNLCAVTGLETGVARNFTAVAINEVGSSTPTQPVKAWAYRGPDAPAGGSSTPVGQAPEGNLAKLTITGIDVANTSKLEISELGEVPVTGETVVVERYETTPGGRSVTVTAKSKFEQPPIGVSGPAQSSASVTIPNVHGIGTPRVAAEVVDGSGDKRTVRVVVNDAMGASDAELTYGIAEGTECLPNGTSMSKEVSVQEGQKRQFTVCAVASWSGGTSPVGVSAPATVEREVAQPSSGGTYALKKTSVESPTGNYIWNEYEITKQPSADGGDIRYSLPGGSPGSFPSISVGFGGTPPSIDVYRCIQDRCSAPVSMRFEPLSNAPSVPTQLTLKPTCPTWQESKGEMPFTFSPSYNVDWGWTDNDKSRYELHLPWNFGDVISGTCNRTDKPSPETGQSDH